MSQALGEIIPGTHDSIWIATAQLHYNNKDRDVFAVTDIFNEIKNLGYSTTIDSTIKQHISSHCVANTYASPDTHRYLYRVDHGKYRLYRPDDFYSGSRENGKMLPVPETIPHKFRFLIDWYNNEYCKKPNPEYQPISTDLENPPYVRIDESSRIKIPDKIKNELNLQNGDFVGFVKLPNGRIQLQKARIAVNFR
ncbi:MAG: DUF7669 domain-containing protein [Rhabdochlamydiaceae bacterium]